MPEENILPQIPTKTDPKKETKKTAVISVLLTIALTIALIILGERVLYDINRWFNPANNQYGYEPYKLHELFIPTAHATVLTPTTSYSRQEYETYRLLLSAAVIIPVFLLMFVIYYILHFRRVSSPYKILGTSYLIFAFYMIVRLLGEISWYMVKNYKTLGVYLVLTLIIVVFTILIIIVQKKLHAKQETA